MIVRYILEVLRFGVNWVFGVKKEKMLIITLIFGLCHVEVWDGVGLGGKDDISLSFWKLSGQVTDQWTAV